MATRCERCTRCGRVIIVPLEINIFSILCSRCQGINPIRPNYPLNQPYYPVPFAPNRIRGLNAAPAFNNNGGLGIIDRAYNPQPQPLWAPPPPLMPASPYGKKRAVLCGISYGRQVNRLQGSVNDVQCMKYFLIDKLGFPSESIRMLTDDAEQKNPLRIPTKYNMRMAMRWLVQGCQPGDSLVFHFSGHGSREVDRDMDEIDGYDEALCPVDYQHEGKIIDDEINATIVRPLPRGAKLHALIDTCFSGTVLDLPFMCRMNRQGYYAWEDHRHPRACYKGTRGGLAVCISACDDDGNAADTSAFDGAESAAGALTYCFIQVMQDEPKLNYGRLLSAMRSAVRGTKAETIGLNGQDLAMDIRQQYANEPQLTSSEKFEIYSKPVVI